MDLVRDLLDKLVVDRNGRELGRVDRIVLDRRAGGPTRVAAIEIGPSVLASRLHPVLGRWVAALEYACGVSEGRPLRIHIGEVLEIDDTVKVARAFADTPAAAIERRARRWLAGIPRWP
jgi:sporulation protein YlmC with PRC-barrel domain